MSVVDLPGRPPKCLLGKREWVSAMADSRHEASADSAILLNVSSRAIGRYALGTE